MIKQLFILALIFIYFLPIPANAHRSGCHRWHSCPSDTGKYVCGDKGYCSQCPNNTFCKNGKINKNMKKYKKTTDTNEKK